MGKNSKAQDAELRRQYQEKRHQEELKKQKAQNSLVWKITVAVLAVVLVVAAIPVAMAGCDKQGNATFGEIEGYTAAEGTTDYVRMNVTYTDKNGKFQSGSIIVCLDPDAAPITVENFQSLVGQKFYDGLTFHRVIEGFMIQGGDPKGDGTGDSGKTIVGEFSSNGYDNPISHTRGVISMARGGYDMNSASCQFFIMHQTNTDLDGDYAAFGKVVYGMETVDGIAGTKVIRSGQSAPPVNPVTIVSMYFVTPTN